MHTRPKSRALFEAIREHILEGRYLPGQWLKQAELESTYGASRSDVRSALSSLSERGIVEYSRNRGFRVFNREPREIRDIIEMIVVLEAAAARSILGNASASDIEELEHLARKFDDLTEKGSHAELRLTNYRFHDQLNALCGNRIMADTIRHLRECCVSGPFERYTTFEGLRASSREHFEIIDALQSGDARKLKDLLRRHTTHST
ncbi:MAG TPA: GntR family transcriptional regulator [Woeseiaceae bacterium]|nr:GntR family transcriptional regulator [Woeseiaceae bacterium]